MYVRTSLAAVALMATAACAVPSQSMVERAPTQAAPSEVVTTLAPTTAQASTPGEPVRLSIPGLGLEATVVPVRSEDGSLDPPSDPSIVGWWADGAQPGSTTGTALLTAHTVHTGGGAFDDLGDLGPADDVVVSTRNGTLQYDVERVATYTKSELAKHAADLFDQTGPGRMVLVTCDDWDGSKYLSNTVVVLRSA
ncbi:MAG TPA: class F sortase [Nocardioidaceae bacterium]|nr:class F sortase [Nocardioidaceae bacterium]